PGRSPSGPAVVAPAPPASPSSTMWPPALGGPGRWPTRGPVPASQQMVPSSPFEAPGPITQNAPPGFFNPSGGAGTQFAGTPQSWSELSNVQLTSDAPQGGADQPLWQRNNNPGNLRYVGQEDATKGDAGFAKFDSMEQGVAALKKQIGRYGSGATTGKPLRSLRQIISTWSPPNENQTDLLIKNASQRMGVSADQELDTSDPAVQEQLA